VDPIHIPISKPELAKPDGEAGVDCSANRGGESAGEERGGDNGDGHAMASQQLGHVNHGDEVAGRAERHQNEVKITVLLQGHCSRRRSRARRAVNWIELGRNWLYMKNHII